MMPNEIMPEQTAQLPAAMTRPEMELLLRCARTRTNPEVSQRIREAAQEEINWIRLIRLALRNGTLPLMYWNLH